MPRPKGSKNIEKTNTSDSGVFVKLQESKKIINKLDDKIPSDNAMTNNQVRASIREARAKINEIINIMNGGANA